MTSRDRHYADAALYVERAARHARDTRDSLGDMVAEILDRVAQLLEEIPKCTEAEE